MNEIAKVPETSSEGYVDELQPGTELFHGQYTITRYLNAGGFGITYLAKDSLKRQVVVKECFPSSFCRRSKLLVMARSRAHTGELRSIVRLFTREAEALAKLQHPNIVSVHQVFEDNNTAYMVIDFIAGHDLLAITKKKVLILRPDQIVEILKKSLGALGCVHKAGLLHRDISPDNIIVNEEMEPVLIDFGAAREQATKATQALSAMRVVKDGYSPQEFYLAGSEQGPESDLYSLAATFYYAITREIPPDSQKRLSAHVAGETDPYVPLARKTADYDPTFCAAIDKAMAILPKDRIQTADDWLAMLEAPASVKIKKVTPKKPAAANTASRRGAGRAVAFAAVGGLALAGAAAFTLVDLPGSTPALTETPAAAETARPNSAPTPAPVTAVAAAGPLANTPRRVDTSGILTTWSVPLPFTLQGNTRIADPGSASWLEPGLRITEINGTKIATPADIADAATSAARAGDGTRATLRIVAEGEGGTTVFGTIDAPVAFDTQLADGTRLRSVAVGGAWETTVLEAGRDSALQVGDLLVGLLDSPAWIDASTSLATVLANEIQTGRTSVRFAVRRAGSMWVERVTLVRQSG